MDKRAKLSLDIDRSNWLRGLASKQKRIKLSLAEIVGRALDIAKKQLEKEIAQ